MDVPDEIVVDGVGDDRPGPLLGRDPALAGQYRCLRRIGVGGMAEVFLARRIVGVEDAPLVVVKRILPAFADDPEFRQRFIHEARLAAHLGHPNVAAVIDFGMSAGGYYMVSEYVPGENLARVLKQLRRAGSRMPLQACVSIAIGAGSGLHHAHQCRGSDGRPLGIVHRDVSPSNVMISCDGHAKVIDFGIATATARTRVTRTAVVVGKSGYISPEQASGGQVDARSDVFALGVVLYEMTTGRAPFVGENEFIIMNRAQLGHYDRPSAVIADYPKSLEAIVVRALDPDPQRRFPTAEALTLALEQFAADHAMLASPLAVGRVMADLGLGPQQQRDPTPNPRSTFVVGVRGAPTASPPGDGRSRRGWRPLLTLLPWLAAVAAASGWLIERSRAEPVAAGPRAAGDPGVSAVPAATVQSPVTGLGSDDGASATQRVEVVSPRPDAPTRIDAAPESQRAPVVDPLVADGPRADRVGKRRSHPARRRASKRTRPTDSKSRRDSPAGSIRVDQLRPPSQRGDGR